MPESLASYEPPGSEPPLLEPTPLSPADEAHAFLVEMATALGTYGVAANRLEEAMGEAARSLGVPAQFFATPTMIICALGVGKRQQVYMCRVEPGDINLRRLVLLDEVLSAVGQGLAGPAYGSARILGALSTPAPGRLLSVASHGLISASAAVFLGGGSRELAVGAVLGLVVGGLMIYGGRDRYIARVLEFLAALFAAFAAVAAAGVMPGLNVSIAALAALIVLLPGLSLTLGVTELATRNLVAGTARLMGAMTVLVSLGFGVALGQRLGALLPMTLQTPADTRVPWYAEPWSVLAAAAAIVVLFKARSRDLWAVAAACAVAFYGGRLGTAAIDSEIGVSFGAFALGCLSNLHARWFSRPVALTMLPGILLLVPGGVGYRSVQSFLADDPVAGVDTLFSMFIIAISLVAGLLLANVAVHPRRSL